MKKSLLVAALIAAACSTAFAAGVKQDQKAAPTPTVKAQVMSDADMDKVTAGFAAPNINAWVHACVNGPGRAPFCN
jgi:hypothetical protein